MEMVLSNGFCEMMWEEMLEVDGGIDATTVIIGIAGFAVGAAVGFAVGGVVGAAIGGKNGGAWGSLIGSAVGVGATALTEYAIHEMIKSDN